jgi:hypothetical protein
VLIEAKLIADTGRLHEGRYKVYHVRWSSEENIKAASKKIKKPIRKVAALKETPLPDPLPKGARGNSGEARSSDDAKGKSGDWSQLTLPPIVEVGTPPACATLREARPSAPLPSTLTPSAILKDNRIAYFAEIAKQRHQENRQLHRSMMLSLRLSADDAVVTTP